MKVKKWLSYIFSFLLIGIIFYFTKDQWQYFEKAKDISAYGFWMVTITLMISQIIHSFQLKWYLEVFDIDVNMNEAFGLICIQSFGNYLPLSGGIVSNLAYLKVKKNLPVAQYFSYLLGDTILKFLIFGVIGLVILVGGSLVFDAFDLNYMVIGSLILLVLTSLFFMFFPASKKKSNSMILNWIMHMHESWFLIRKNKILILKSTISHILILILIATQFLVLFRELGVDISFPAILILTIITNIIKITSLFPGNLGLREAVSGGVTQIFGFPFSTGFTASLVGRAISMIWIFSFGIYYALTFARHFRK